MKKIPKFKSEEEAARFWETHSFEEYQADTKEAEIEFVKKPKKTVALRLDPADIKSVEAIAKKKGLSYTALLRMWIKEHLAKGEAIGVESSLFTNAVFFRYLKSA